MTTEQLLIVGVIGFTVMVLSIITIINERRR